MFVGFLDKAFLQLLSYLVHDSDVGMNVSLYDSNVVILNLKAMVNHGKYVIVLNCHKASARPNK